ncbi:MAG: sigma-54-dependent Fis family transcriptional regulator [Bacteroidetes bacterium HGW-Bacteroidetes-22]|nr:MAG: sigma-54-dependent Fis family transcriptional regulator [Bacteroidetes bacterium HGW-Bacteroidetes-22]
MEVQSIKHRFGIMGNSVLLERAIDIARQVAPTDISVLITGESGVGKEVFPQIIHQLSTRKHGAYIAVNCGAIPEGTIDSELFGHEKGSFTGAHESRKGYFEVADGGTIFLDEVAELPLSTQVRLLRVLETGEFIKVGSSKVIKTNVRVVAATNVTIPDAINQGRFRQDLYYRLNSVPIYMPPLRERKDDIHLLFRKFAADFAEKYRMPAIHLSEEAVRMLANYRWPGNIRQLKNITEQISIIEQNREISSITLHRYLPENNYSELPVLVKGKPHAGTDFDERDLLYKVLFDMKKDITELRKLVGDIISHSGVPSDVYSTHANVINRLNQHDYDDEVAETNDLPTHIEISRDTAAHLNEPITESEVIEENLSLEHRNVELIRRALRKHDNKRKSAAKELGISERTLYRKIKEHGLD